MVLAQREPKFIGIQPSGSSKEKKPPMNVQRKLDFRGSQQDQREHHLSRGNLPSGTRGRDESSKQVSWVEEARHEVYRKEASRRYVPSMEDSIVSTGFFTVIEEADNQVDKRVGFASVIDGVTSETYWIVKFTSMIEDAACQKD